jgi:hypothetical protein
MHIKVKNIARGLSAGLCIGFVGLAIIPWLGWPWHLIHGSILESSGVLFKVPARYFSLASTDAIQQ